MEDKATEIFFFNYYKGLLSIKTNAESDLLSNFYVYKVIFSEI